MALLLVAPQLACGDAPEAGGVARTDTWVTSADGQSLFTRQYGAGDTPIILLTGGPGYSGDYLEEMALRLGEQHRVILPDQRGTGRSLIEPWDASRVAIEACVSDVEALRAHSGAEQVVVMGHSWGGVLAMAYAAEHGRHVRALVLIGSCGADSKWNMRYSLNLMARLSREDMAAVLKAQGRMAKDPEAGMVDMIRATAPAMMMDRELAIRLADEYSGPEYLTPAVTLAMQGWLQRYDFSERLDGLDAPVLIVQGDHDILGEETAREIADLFPRSELHFIENAAHEPYVEQPEAFYAIVEPFLSTWTK
jgi:proline iminopeptidase